MAMPDHIGTRIKRALDADDSKSVAELAAKAGVTVQAIYNKWIPKGQIDKKHVPLVAEYLGLSVDELMTGISTRSYHQGREVSRLNVAERSDQQYLVDSSMLVIEQLNVAGGMAPDGVMAPEHVDVVHQVRVDVNHLRRLVSFTAPSNLRVVTGYGDSMLPTFCDGDPLIIDVGIKAVTIDAVYVLERENNTDRKDIFIKRIQRRPITDEYLMISDNTIYPPVVLTQSEWKKFRVAARVLLAWNARRL